LKWIDKRWNEALGSGTIAFDNEMLAFVSGKVHVFGWAGRILALGVTETDSIVSLLTSSSAVLNSSDQVTVFSTVWFSVDSVDTFLLIAGSAGESSDVLHAVGASWGTGRVAGSWVGASKWKSATDIASLRAVWNDVSLVVGEDGANGVVAVTGTGSASAEVSVTEFVGATLTSWDTSVRGFSNASVTLWDIFSIAESTFWDTSNSTWLTWNIVLAIWFASVLWGVF
jgi:hypothetical protein